MDVTDFQDFKVADSIKTIYPPFILIIGLCGNGMSFFVLCFRLEKRRSSTVVYLIVLSITDSLVLVSAVLIDWISHMTKIDIRGSSDNACRIIVFVVYTALQLSSWVLVHITIERVLSVVYPYRIKVMCTKTRAWIIVCCLIVILCGLNAHFLFGYQLEYSELHDLSRCVVKTSFEHFNFKIWPWVDFIVQFLIPFLIFGIGNILIIIKLRQYRVFRKSSIRTSMTGHRHSTGSKTKLRKKNVPYYTVMSVVLSSVFLICVTPASVFFVGQPYWFPVETMTTQTFANLTLIGTIVKMIMYTNSSLNFVLYMLSGSKFRNQAKYTFCWWSSNARYDTVTSIASKTSSKLRNMSFLPSKKNLKRQTSFNSDITE